MNPRIYVACLAAYNNGKLHGEWIDADQDTDDIMAEIKEILHSSPESQHKCHAEECGYEGQCDEDGCCPECGEEWGGVCEEWAIHDHEDFCGYEVSEYEDIETVSEIGKIIAKISDDEAEAFAAWLDNGNEPDEDKFREDYAGTYRSAEEWAESFLEDTGGLHDMPENLRYYFDYEAYARDAQMGGDIWVHEGENGTHVFWNN